MSRSRGGGGRGRGGRVLQAQLTRSSLTLLSLPLLPPPPLRPLGEYLFLFLHLSYSLTLLFPFARPSRLALFFFLSRFSVLFLFSSGVSVPSRSPSCLLLAPPAPRAFLQRQHQLRQQHPSKRKDFDPRFVLLAFCRNFPDFVFRLRVENQAEREKKREKEEGER